MEHAQIDRVLSGDTEAFRYFITHYEDMAFNLAVSIVKDDHFAEEVVQDAFMNAFNALNSFNRKAQFKSWFYRIVVNESFQRLRKLKKSVPVVDITAHQDFRQNHPEEEDPKLQAIKLSIQKLPPNESLALNLFYLEEYSLKEIGNITGWTASNTKVILHRARKNLRTKLTADSTKKG